jgi:hypothetical protein
MRLIVSAFLPHLPPLPKKEGAKVQIVGSDFFLFVLSFWCFLEMHLCTSAMGKGEMLPVFFSRKFGLHPLVPPAPCAPPHPTSPTPDAPHSVCLHICALSIHLTKGETPRLPALVYLHIIMSTSAHLTKVMLLDFPCLSVYRSSKPLHIWQRWNPLTSRIRCSTHM